MSKKNALKVTRKENFADWYQEVISEAKMAEHAGVRGCMIILPWGFKIWDRIQKHLDQKIQDSGHDNCYFPILIPMELIEKEAQHVKGFAKEMAVVTHHRLEKKEDKLAPSAPLKTPLVLRPTSEALITSAFGRWIQSYRDLPIKINQWANVVRWEMRPRLFLRTSEFLWQEGHTAHESSAEAVKETQTMVEVYRGLLENFMAIPVFLGVKSKSERFPGAVETHTLEAIMQDGRALQVGTSHFLGQNFSKANKILFSGRDGDLQTPYTTSWGVSTRLIGALIMSHADDDGLRLPPKLAPYQVVIVPINWKEEKRTEVNTACENLANRLRQQSYCNEPIRIFIDSGSEQPVTKRWAWVKKGVPLIIEVGPRDIEKDQVTIFDRMSIKTGSQSEPSKKFVDQIGESLANIQNKMLDLAKQYRSAMSLDHISNFKEMQAHFQKGFWFCPRKVV